MIEILEHQHDFTSARWGHSLLSIHHQGEAKYSVMAIGRGVKEGHELLIKADCGTLCRFKVEKVEYNTNPPDLFKAECDNLDEKS